MKEVVAVHYYNDGQLFEAHVESPDSEWGIVYFKSTPQSKPQFEIQYKAGYVPSIPIPDFTTLPEEEVFQTSLVWDEPYTVHFLLAVQKYMKCNIHKWSGFKSYDEITLEY